MVGSTGCSVRTANGSVSQCNGERKYVCEMIGEKNRKVRHLLLLSSAGSDREKSFTIFLSHLGARKFGMMVLGPRIGWLWVGSVVYVDLVMCGDVDCESENVQGNVK